MALTTNDEVVVKQPATPKDPLVILKDVANASGKEIKWDAGTGNVTANGNQYTSKQLSDAGGVVVNNRWQLPESFVNQMLGNTTPTANAGGLESLLNDAKGISQGYLDEQTGQLQTNLNEELANIRNTYEQAVADGKMSVVEAQKAFEEQKAVIEKKAYQAKDETALYANELGIQNSQQNIGLMAGDNARTQGLINSNISDRDSRLNTIRDRLSAITNQKNIAEDLAQKNYNSGLLTAKGQAGKMFSEQAFNLKSQDYFMDKEQNFQREVIKDEQGFQEKMTDKNFANTMTQMATAQGYDLQKMDINQKYNMANMAQQLQNSIKLATQNSILNRQEMSMAHGFDMQKIGADFRNQLEVMDKEFALNSQAGNEEYKKKVDLMEKEYSYTQKSAVDQYKTELNRALAGVTPGTPEYELLQKTFEQGLQRQLIENNATFVNQYATDSIVNNPNLPTDGKMPGNLATDLEDSGGLNEFMLKSNPVYWLNKGSIDKEQASQDAVKELMDLINAGGSYAPYSIPNYFTD